MRTPAPLAAALLALAAAGCKDDPAPAVCDASQKTIAQSGAPAEQVQRLGGGQPIRVGTAVTFTVPPNTASLTIVEQAVSAPDTITFRGGLLDNTPVPLTVRAPGGEVWFDDNPLVPPPALEELLGYFASVSATTGTLTLPNTSRGLARVAAAGALPAGTWTVVVSDFAYECSLSNNDAACGGSKRTDSTYDVTVVTKAAVPGVGIPAAGTVDFNFHIVGTQTASRSRPLPLSVAAAEADPNLQRMVGTLGTILGQAGLALGTVRWFVAPADLRSRYGGDVDADATGPCAPLAQLFRTAPAGNALNVFLVNGFTAKDLPPGKIIAGVDGTIPGPATFGGTVASGAAVKTSNLRGETVAGACGAGAPVDFERCGDDNTAYIAAHEAGHFLGLYHTTEQEGTSFDPLASTPTCACTTCNRTAERCQDANGSLQTPHVMDTAECTPATARDPSCGGGDNLMFWFAGTGALLDREQVQVMLANPQVR
jgi:hypothetical protein